MRIGRNDRVVDKLNARLERVRGKLQPDKKEKPFRMELVDNDTLLYIYENMSPEDIGYGIQSYGLDAVDGFMVEMEQLKRRRLRV